MTLQASTKDILPNLERISSEIRRIANYLNPYIQRLELTTDIPQVLELDYARNLRECVRSSASVVSSASTILAGDVEDEGSVVADSDFGNCFPELSTVSIQGWIDANTIVEEANIADAAPEYLAANSDSDGDLDTEMTEALLNQGWVKCITKEYADAERLLKSCDSRLSKASRSTVPSSRRKMTTLRLKALDLLIHIYRNQEKMDEVRAILTIKIALRQDLDGDSVAIETLSDILSLAKILWFHKRALSEAQLQARRALRGYKKLGVEGQTGLRETLRLLIDISEAEGNSDDTEAYKACMRRFEFSSDLHTSYVRPLNETQSSVWYIRCLHCKLTH